MSSDRAGASIEYLAIQVCSSRPTIGATNEFYLISTVNMASRMMSTGLEGHVHLSEAVANKIKAAQHALDDSYPLFTVAHRGKTPVKGKGEIDTYWLVAPTIESARTRASDLVSGQQSDPTSPVRMVAGVVPPTPTGPRPGRPVGVSLI